MALKGAEILFYPTAIGDELMSEYDSSGSWQRVMQGHAAANIMPVVASNRIGSESVKGQVNGFYGKSFICDRSGKIISEASKDKGVLENAVKDLEAIAGQKVVVTKARKAVASFKIREEYPIGCKVTLRGDRMYDFFERLVDLAIPREKDFRGLSEKSFDGQGNYNMGVKEQIIFPEIDYDKVDKLRGMDIAITTSAKDDSSAKELLQSFNFPFRGKNG